MQIVNDHITIAELRDIAKGFYGNLVKAVVDIEKRIMVVGGDLHADEEAFMLQNGSAQKDLWGINIYPAGEGDQWIEFDSMINLKPQCGNRSRGVEDFTIQKKIRIVVNKLIHE